MINIISSARGLPFHKQIKQTASMANDLETGGTVNGSGKPRTVSKLYEFKEQLLLLSTLVATVTYVAGLNLPGGSWEQDDPGGHMAGDPILRDTHYRRYLAFYYCNATALAASLVVSLILIILEEKHIVWTVVLRMVMMLDLLSLMGAYGAGSCRDTFTTIFAVVVFSFLVLIIIFGFFYLWLHRHDKFPSNSNSNSNRPIAPPGLNSTSKSRFFLSVRLIQKQRSVVKSFVDAKKEEKEKIDVLMLLATFAVTITYVAGLSPPGGFWSSTEDGHRLSDPVLQARGRYRAFFVCNTTSFAVSLLIIVLLLEKKLLKKQLSEKFTVRFTVPYVLIAVALLGLMVAYAAGSCREADNTIFVLTLTAAVPVCVCLQLVVVACTNCWEGLATKCGDVLGWFKRRVNTPRGTSTSTDIELHLQNTRYLVMLLATLVVTITYQAGLDPPGGLWLDSRDGHTIGHPVLQTTHPTRYQVFFYSNSAAFVTSLVVIMMLQSKYLLTRHTLEATLVLDLFGLITAYGAGSTRDVNASFYIIALAGIVLVYVVVHITIRDHDPEPAGGDAAVKVLDDKRKVLLLVAILAATLTYQAGLTPPGGFWLADDQGLGRRAGFPVLLDNYPPRYHAFFYCNAASFMASVTLILLLINPKLYRPGIRCYALYVCMLVGMFGLMGAYAAGSSRHLKTSIILLTLVAAVSTFIALLVAIFWYIYRYRKKAAAAVEAAVTMATTASAAITTAAAAATRAAEAATTETTTTTAIIAARLTAGATTTSTVAPTTETTTTTAIIAARLIAGATTTSTVAPTTETTTTAARLTAAATTTTPQAAQTTATSSNSSSSKEKERLEYLMLLGILGASMTYQTGLKPPGGLWQDNMNGHYAGNPILHDTNKHRYNAFFYGNSTSFMASIVVVVMLLPLTFHEHDLSLWPMHSAILLDMLSLLVAYAAGSTREWETSRNVMLLVIPVLLYIAVYVTASVFYNREGPVEPPTQTPASTARVTATPHQEAN
ncbi:uncharacterized protein [Aegilops tauschii subsp. strangulata]|nr:uncharacterized protein LOC109733746 [Aegilops tauschii subsp. strangulata]